MKSTYVRVKGIIKKDDKYLLIKRWVDDHIPEPFVWEFIDAEVAHGEAPDEAMLHAISELLSVNGTIEKIEYTWAQLIWEWVKREQFPYYIENQYVLKDLEGKTL